MHFCNILRMYHEALRVRPSYNEALNDLVHALQVPPHITTDYLF